jgi:cytochrome c
MANTNTADKAPRFHTIGETIMIKTLIAATVFFMMPFAASAQDAATGDAVAGAVVFKKCAACHIAVEAKNKVGPHLVGIVGRKAGSAEGFKYSEAMAAKGTEGMIWDEANITAYLKDPKGFVPKNKMAFAGLKADADIVNVIAYLKADPKP